MKPTKLTADEERTLIAKAQQGDIDARNELVERLLPVLRYQADKFQFHGSADVWDDMVSEGSLGAMQAIKSFDLARGCRLSTYAVPRIRGAIQDFLRYEQPLGFRRKRNVPQMAVRSLSSFEVDLGDNVRNSIEPTDKRDLQHRERSEAEAHLCHWLQTKLGHRDAEMFRLYFIEGITMKAIGLQLGLSESRISQRMKLCRQWLAEGLH